MSHAQDFSPDPVDVTVGARVRLARKMRGATQQAMAEAIGVSFQQVQKYERGSNRVSASMLVRIADFLHVDIADLFGRATARPALDEEVAEVLATTGAMEMLSAYAGLTGPSRTALLSFMRALRKDTAATPA